MTKEVPFGKKYVVRLDAAERARLQDMVSKGKHSARLQSRARILLKADVGEAGEGWSDSAIARALDTSIATVERVRQQLVEEGFESILTRKHNPNSARKEYSTVRKKRGELPWLAAPRRRAAPVGRCNCWKRRSSNSPLSITPATIRSGGF